MPARTGVEAEPEAPPAVVIRETGNPDSSRPEVARVGILAVQDEVQRGLEERAIREDVLEPRRFRVRQAFIEDEAAIPVLGAHLRGPGREPRFVSIGELGEPLRSESRQPRIAAEQDPGDELGPDAPVELGVDAGEIDEQADDPLELAARRLAGRPLQLFAVSRHAPPQGVEAAQPQPGGDDGLDGGLVEEGQARMEESGEEAAVVRVRLVEEQDPVGGAADPLLRVAGQGAQPPPHDGRRPEIGIGGERLDLLQRGRGLRRVREQRRFEERVHPDEPVVADPAGSRQVLRRIGPLPQERQGGVLGDGLEGHVPALPAGAEADERRVPQPQPGLAGEEPEVDEISPDLVLQVADEPPPLALGAGNRQHEAAVRIEQEVAGEVDLVLEHPQVPEEPVRDPDPDVLPLELDVIAAVEVLDFRREMGLDFFPVEGAFGRQLLPPGLEVPAEHGEVDDALAGRQVDVGRVDEPAVILALLVRAQSGLEDLVAVVRDDEEHVVRPPVPHEEGPLDARDADELVLHLQRRDGLPARVLVKVLDPVDDFEIAVRQDAEYVARRQPVILLRALRIGHEVTGTAVLQVSGDVRAAHLELAVRPEPRPGAGQRTAERPVDVPAGRRHGDPARPLGHAEAARDVDAVALEESEDARIEVPGGRQTPAQAPADDASERGFGALSRPGGVEPRQAPLVELGPTDGHTDEARGLDLGKQGEQRFGRGVAGEDVRAAPIDRAEELEIAAERVEERQEAQQDLLAADFRERRGPGEALGDEVVDREGNALGPARAARGEHDRRRFVQREPPAGGEETIGLGRAQGLGRLAQEGRRGVIAGRAPVQGDDAERGRRPRPDLFEKEPFLPRVRQGQGDAQPVEDLDEIVPAEMRVERRIQDVVKQAGQVGDGALHPVLRQDGHPRLAAVPGGQGEQGGRRLARQAVDLLVTPQGGNRGAHVLEEDPAGMAAKPRPEKVGEPEIGKPDQPEDGFGPPLARRLGPEGLQVGAEARFVEQGVDGVPRGAVERPRGQAFEGVEEARRAGRRVGALRRTGAPGIEGGGGFEQAVLHGVDGETLF